MKRGLDLLTSFHPIILEEDHMKKNKVLDFLFPRCHVYGKWGNYIKTKRVFILKYLWRKR